MPVDLTGHHEAAAQPAALFSSSLAFVSVPWVKLWRRVPLETNSCVGGFAGRQVPPSHAALCQRTEGPTHDCPLLPRPLWKEEK